MIDFDENEHIWENKYRPQSIDDVILPEKDKVRFQNIIKKGEIPNIVLISNSPGTGKTTVAKIIAGTKNHLFYNTADVNVNVIRNDIRRFASSRSADDEHSGGNVVILDEFDRASKDLQKTLLAFVEEYSSNCTFIMTANYGGNFTKAMKSRFRMIEFGNISTEEKPTMMKAMIRRALLILENEGIEVVDKKVVAALVKMKFPDFRDVVKTLDHASLSGEIDESVLETASTDALIEELFGYLKAKNWKEVRSLIPKVSHDYPSFIDRLFKSLPKYISGRTMPEAIFLIYDNQKFANDVPNMEIHISGMLVQLMVEVEWK